MAIERVSRQYTRAESEISWVMHKGTKWRTSKQSCNVREMKRGKMQDPTS